MSALIVLAGLLAAALFAYLILALLTPERFQ